MKVKIDIADNFIDVWNEEKEIWERYVKIELEEEPQEHKIPEKLTIGVNEYDEIHINNEIYGERQVRVVADKINEILDYLNLEE